MQWWLQLNYNSIAMMTTSFRKINCSLTYEDIQPRECIPTNTSNLQIEYLIKENKIQISLKRGKNYENFKFVTIERSEWNVWRMLTP